MEHIELIAKRPTAEPEFRFGPLIGYRSRKAAQIAAFFAGQEGVTIEKLKLIKLIYLAERENISRHGFPMLYDELRSLEHGPICSSTLNGINGKIDQGAWREFLSRDGNNIAAAPGLTREKLDELSNANIAVLQFVWGRFGGMTSSQLRRYTHENCEEYTEVPKGRSLPISYSDVLRQVRQSDAEWLDAEISLHRRLDALATPE